MPLIRLFRLVNGFLLILVAMALLHFGAGQMATYLRLAQCAQALQHWRGALQLLQQASEETLPPPTFARTSLAEELSWRRPLVQIRLRTDEALQAFAAGPPERGSEAELDEARRLKVLARLQPALQAVRARVDAEATSASPSPELVLAQSTLAEATSALLPLVDSAAAAAMRSDPGQRATVQAAQAVALLHPAADALRAALISPLKRGGAVTPRELAEIARLAGRIALLQEQAERKLDLLSPQGELNRLAQRVREGFFGQSQDVLLPLLQSATKGEALAPGAAYFAPGPSVLSPPFERDLADLLLLRDALIDESLQQAEQSRGGARREIVLVAMVLVAVGLCLAGLMRLLHTRVIRPLAEAARAIHDIAGGDDDVEMPQVPDGDEVGEVVGALHKLQGSQRRAAQLAAERDALIDKLRALSSTDPLTGLLNRRAFFESAERELANGLRHGFEVAVLLMDIDHFKAVNDEHGHAAGDQALVAVAACLQASLRQGDVLARHGGEEFVVLLTHCGRLSAIGFAERLRQSVSEIQLSSADKGDFRLTASLGVAASGDNGAQLSALLSQADAAMYCAKRAGRDQVMAAPALAGAHPSLATPAPKTLA